MTRPKRLTGRTARLQREIGDVDRIISYNAFLFMGGLSRGQGDRLRKSDPDFPPVVRRGEAGLGIWLSAATAYHEGRPVVDNG